MKKINFDFFINKVATLVVASIVGLGFASCSDSIVENESEEAGSYDIPTFSASEDVQTYTAVSSDYKVLWQLNDAIGIFCEQTDPVSVNRRGVLLERYIGKSNGSFKSDINWTKGVKHTYYTYYPWKDGQTTPTAVHHAIERVQTQKGNDNSEHIGKSQFMHGRCNEVLPSSGYLDMKFKHTTAIVEISFKSQYPEIQGKPLTQVVLKADNGAIVTGDFDIDITQNNPRPNFTSPCDSVIINLQDVTMPTNSTDVVKVYAVINPAAWTTATVRYIVDGVQYEMTKNFNRTLEKQNIYTFETYVDYGAITVNPLVVFLSPNTPSATVTLNSTHPWKIENEQKASVSATSGNKGTSNITFTRKTSLVDYGVYGNTTVSIKAVGKDMAADVQVCNLFLSAPDEIYIGNPRGADTTILIKDIIPYGGDSAFVIDNYTSDGGWIQSVTYDAVNVGFRLKATHNNALADRTGSITVHHVNDPSYQITVPIIQNEFVYIPEFKYFVIDIDWCHKASLDLDIAFMFENNNPATPFEHIPVGYGAPSSASQGDLVDDPGLINKPADYSNLRRGATGGPTGLVVMYKHQDLTMDSLMFWGGDAVDGQGETVYFDAELFNRANDVPRYLNLGLYLTWWAHYDASEDWTVRVTLRFYKGGHMIKYSRRPGADSTNYKVSDDGVLVADPIKFFIDLSHDMYHTPKNFMTTFTYAAKIKYDRINHNGRMSETDPSNPKWSENRNLCKNGHDSDPYTGEEILSVPINREEMDRIYRAKAKAAAQLFK